MGNNQSGGKSVIEDDVVSQNRIDLYLHKCLTSDCYELINKPNYFKDLDNELHNSIFRYVHNNQLNDIKYKCNLGECSREETVEFYFNKIKLILMINYSIKYLADLLNPSNDKEISDNNNLCVETINQLNKLIKNLYCDEQKTVYENGKSIKKRIIIDIPTKKDEYEKIKNEFNKIIELGNKTNKTIFRKIKTLL